MQRRYDCPMGRVQTIVQLTDELVELLDREAARRGVSRSALIPAPRRRGTPPATGAVVVAVCGRSDTRPPATRRR
jgi:Ribbon-helix-helix protein, copG family